jgi:phosphoribosylformylglycinamidine cyclo-ligase
MENLTKSYAKAGVDTKKEDSAMKKIKPLFKQTFKNRKGLIGESLLPELEHYAAIVKITDNQYVAIKTDGVGTKTFIAQYMDKYDTIGIDCVAMNVNDILCTGAEPISFLDYLAVQKSDPDLIEEIAKGLKTGADIAKVNIVGGETAIMPHMINGVREKIGFDLAGSALGSINPADVVDGSEVKDGDILIGISSSGVHSNGLTLARHIFCNDDNFLLNNHFELGQSVGEELLKPTYIYVDEIIEMIREGIKVKLLAHITSDGLRNLTRIGENFGFEINYLPQPQAIFDLIQKYGRIDDTEMYEVYNMGIGMCAVLPREQCDSALQIAEKYGKTAFVMGKAVIDADKKIKIKAEIKAKTLKIMSVNEDRFIKY